MSLAAPDEYIIRTCPILPEVKLSNGDYYDKLLSKLPSSFLQVVSYAFLIVPLHYCKITCSTICNDEIAGARQNMNCKVAAYEMTYLPAIYLPRHLNLLRGFSDGVPVYQELKEVSRNKSKG